MEGIRDKDSVSLLVSQTLRCLGNLGEEGMANIRDDESDSSCLALDQAPGYLVGTISELPGTLDHPISGSLAKGSLAGQGIGYGR